MMRKLTPKLGFLTMYFATAALFVATNVVASPNILVDESVEQNEMFLTETVIENNDVFHLISHGKPGHLLIEGSWLDAHEIAIFLGERKSDVKHINIYGCEFAKGEAGKQAVLHLEKTLGVTISASDDITGIDGDWDLEIGESNSSISLPNYKFNLQTGPTEDFDGDGVTNENDFDDDNDGILDTVESPNCFYAEEEVNSIVAVTSDLASLTAAELANTHDGSSTTRGIGVNNEDVVNQTIYELEMGGPVLLSGVDVESRYTIGDNTTEIKWQGWDGTSWIDVTDDITTTQAANSTQSYTFTKNLDYYSRYRIYGVSGDTYLNYVEEFMPIVSTDYEAALNPKPTCSDNTDGDSNPNHLDTDSDGDGCADATEGSGDFTNDDLTTSNNLCEASTCVDGDGVPTNAGAPQGIGTSQNASILDLVCPCTDPDSLTNNCDFDGDSVVNALDLDDDNDGILDSVESPNCFYAEEEVSTIVAVTSDLASLTAAELANTHDGDSNTRAVGLNNEDVVDQTVYELEMGGPVLLSGVDVESQYTIGDNTTEIKWQGWDGNSWIDVTDDITTTQALNSTQSYTFTKNLDYYSKYRIYGVSGDTYSNRVEEFMPIVSADYKAALNPKPTCTDDADGDGNPNHLDTDSDDDGCADATEGYGDFTNDDLTTSDNLCDGPTCIDGDGVPTIAGAPQNIGTSQNASVLDLDCPCTDSENLTNNCDYDGDGVLNALDLDDDNDGILDAVESPNCFYAEEEVNSIVAVTSDLASLTAAELANTHDGSSTTRAVGANNEDVVNQTIYEIEMAGPVLLSGVDVESQYTIGDNATVIKWQGWDGSSWIDVTDDITTTQASNSTQSYTFTKNLDYYSRYRIYGVSGDTYLNYVEEFTPIVSADYKAGLNPKPTCTDDADGDDILNHLDTDSDDDGCADATEGSGDFTNDDLTTSDNLCDDSTCVDADGVPTAAGAPQNIGTSQNASILDLDCPCIDPNNLANNCDFDGDGVVNALDLDDDNDGILDAVESPNCFYAEEEIDTIVAVTSDLASLTAAELENTHDGDSSTRAVGLNNEDVVNQTIYELEMEGPALLSGVDVESLYTIGDNATVIKWQGWDGTSWIDVTDDITTTQAANSTQSYTFTKNLGHYTKYRIYGVSGDTYSNRVEEFIPIVSADYEPALNPKPSCIDDTDGDGSPNHLDKDSDDDGCADATEGAGDFTNDDLTTSDNLCDGPACVDTDGVPTNTGARQDKGYSQNGSKFSYDCPCTDPNKFANNCDLDGDGLVNGIDHDDDNDGILDKDEAECNDLAQEDWEASNGEWTIPDGDFEIILDSETPPGTEIIQFNNQTFANQNFWSEDVGGLKSLQLQFNWDDDPEVGDTDIDLPGDDQGSIEFTIDFGREVINPVIHIDKLGGYTGIGIISNSALLTLVTPDVTLTKLAGTDDFEVTPTTIQRTPDIVTTENTEAAQAVNAGTSAGSVQVNGEVSSVTFSLSGVGVEGVGGDMMEFIFGPFCNLQKDTDGDGIPDYLDLDSDNDGCPDSIEGDEDVTEADLNPDGSINSGVDAQGVPTPVNSGGDADDGDDQGQGVGSSTDASIVGCSTNAENDVNQTPQGVPVSGNLLQNDTDDQGDDQRVTSITINGQVVTIPDGGSSGPQYIKGVGTIVVNSDGSYTFTPDPDFTGPVPSIPYSIIDETGAIDKAQLDIDVLPSMPETLVPPIAVDDTNTVEQGGTVSTNFLGNDSDPEGQTVTLVPNSLTGLDEDGDPIVIPTGTATDAVDVYDENGNLAGTAYIDSTTGELVFTADNSFTGEVPFKYTIEDEDDLEDSAKITITVDPSDADTDLYANNDANSGPAATSVNDPNAQQTGNVIDNDNDPESTDIDVTGFKASDGTMGSPGDTITLPSGGTLTMNADGTYTYNPAPGFVGTEVVEYTIVDENGDVSTAIMQLTTASGKVPPVAIDDTNTVEQGATVSTNFLGNDSDPEGQDIDLVENSMTGLDENGDPITIPTGTATDAVDVYDEDGNLAGTAYIDSTTGELVFTADTDFTGEVPFEYEIVDEDDLTDKAKITITVEPDDGENDTVANDDTNSGPLDDPQSGNIIDNDNDPEGDDQSIASITLDTTGDGNLNTITPVAGTAYPIYQTVNGVITQIGTITVDPDTGAYVYDPIPTFQGTAVVYYTKTDGGDADVTDPATDKATLYLTTLGQTPISLPVELAEFTAEALELDGVLRWTTASESNNSHFEVEHSKNGVDFEFLTNVASKAQDGNSQASLSYSFVDKGAADWRKEEGSTVYYRLKQVDTDGQFAYSPIRLVDFKDVEITSTVFPNPVSNGQAITVQMKDIERVEVFTTGGELVRLVQEPTPVSSTSIDTNDLATGMYIVVVNNKTTMKFIVQ